MDIKESRRAFLKQSLAMMAAGAAVSVLPKVSLAETEQPAATHPYPYKELDAEHAMQVGYDGYFENGCAYGAAKGLLTELQAKVGFPYTVFDPAIFANGKEGYGAGSMCGALGGAVAVIGMCCAPDDARALTKELFAWYTSTPLPVYQPEGPAPVQTIAGSVNCDVSVTTFMTTADVERKDPVRKRRCGGVTADVIGKTIELLNVFFGFAEAKAEEEITAGENQYIATADGFGGPVTVRVTMDGDKIANVEVLKHGETAGIGTRAVTELPVKFVGLTAAELDAVEAVSGATVSSGAITNAVKAAVAMAR